MTFNAGTSTDYIALLDDAIAVLTSDHLETAAINNPGTSGTYVVGEILTIDNTGATNTHDAQIEIVAVSGGQITEARIYRGGAYTVEPSTTTGNAVTGGSGSGATFDLTFDATGWTQKARQSELAAAPSVAAGGTGYSVSDVLTLVGGVLAPGGSPATVTVATLGTSDVATVTLTTAGDYEVYPTGDIATTVAPSGGTGCTLNATWDDVAGDTIVVLQGDAGAAIDPLIGIKTYSSETDESGVNTVYNWALFGMTSWSSSLPLHEQANISDGFHSDGSGAITSSATGDGAFVPLKAADAFNIEWTIRATGRSVTIVAKVEGASTVYDSQASFGLFNPVGVSSEFPFPAYVCGTSDRKKVWYRDTSAIFGGIVEVITRANGPFFVWAPEGGWLAARVALLASNVSTTPTYNGENTAPRCNVWPLGQNTPHADTDDAMWAAAPTNGFDNDDLTLTSSATRIYRTPDSGGDIFPLFPVYVTQASSPGPDYRTFGMLDGVWWFDVADASVSSGSRHNQDGAFYAIFQNGTRVEPFSFFALRED